MQAPVYTAPVLGPRTQTRRPVVTGSSVIGIRFKGGALIVTDTLASYGSMARFRQVDRVRQIGNNTLIAAGGDYSDYEEIYEMLKRMDDDDFCQNDGYNHTPKEYHSYLTRVMYQRRNKMDPLWNQCVVLGKDFLGVADLYGSSYTDNFVATGFAAHLALPLLRQHWKADMSEEDATRLAVDCMRVCFYRDCRTNDKVVIGKIAEDGNVSIAEPARLNTYWEHPLFVSPHLY